MAWQKGESGNPTGIGGFKRGQSGNPGGRPKVVREIQELARQCSWEALEVLNGIMTDPENPPAARITAAIAILDRGWGKPAQAIQSTVTRVDVDPRSLTDAELAAIIAREDNSEPPEDQGEVH